MIMSATLRKVISFLRSRIFSAVTVITARRGRRLTAMWKEILNARSARTGIPREEIFAKVVDTIPLKRPQELVDITSVVLFLSSEISRNITGESVSVNGGVCMD